ncbi:MAG: hypothetical protein D6786_04325 [Gammaproteobacteria bacterium]|nr:MAG: hypothetical protein D6786_04325 [Gammaproteobacteria bacterium]
MKRGQQLLIAGGLALTLLGMSFGLWYALYDEHQTLGAMGASLASAMGLAAEGDEAAALKAVEAFGNYRFEYVRDVHAHSHWGSLGLLLILLGFAGAESRYRESALAALALLLLYGAFAFPLGVMLQPLQAGVMARVLSISGALCLVTGLFAWAWGLLPATGGRGE